ncbi:MAG: S-adenosylmethionine:tRNA ribosyltransferase-isomerase, partial [Massilibacteroides sp.]|nr:S-adenosylmethionine:tRNA ribosyltransferase-isomerase [Massilibacteroides sp.]
GNAKKWKTGILEKEIHVGNRKVTLCAEKKESYGESHLIHFSWNDPETTFAELLDAAGILPIPPYLNRETEENDLKTYQTVYSKIKGSVAAPTAGLHFTEEVLDHLDKQGFGREEVTLHVGAGTFKPVKSETIETHQMHAEFISVNRSSIERILANSGHIIAVGTTSVRTLESLYYIGVRLSKNPLAEGEDLSIDQWMPYDEANNLLSVEEALRHVLDYLDRHKANKLLTSTRIIIAPGYTFKIVNGMITNFHQPQSTLLLLVSAFVKGNWKPIYKYALEHDFRFLSYGDSSLLL